jgi:hypothetical protein
MAVDRVGGGGSSVVVDSRREESGWSGTGTGGRASGAHRVWLASVPCAQREAEDLCTSLVEVMDPSALEAPEASAAPGTPDVWVDEELREVLTLTLTHPGSGATFRLEATPEVAARLRDGALPGFEPLVPSTLPRGSTLVLAAREAEGARGPSCEVRRLEDGTVRILAMPSGGVVEEPFAALLASETGQDAGGTHTVERALGWTADLDPSHPVALVHYREFCASGEVPVTHRAGGVLRSGRVAGFTDSCAPAIELRFLRDFAWLDCERVESHQRVVEYEDGGVEVRSRTRFSGGRQLFATILVEALGRQVRGDHSLVLSHLTPGTVASLAALFGERHEGQGPCHARLRLTDDEAMRWRDMARARVCQQTGISVGRFDTEARTPDMGAWKGWPQLISLALARTPGEVADAVARFHPTAEGLVTCLVRLAAVMGERLSGSLAVVPATVG